MLLHRQQPILCYAATVLQVPSGMGKSRLPMLRLRLLSQSGVGLLLLPAASESISAAVSCLDCCYPSSTCTCCHQKTASGCPVDDRSSLSSAVALTRPNLVPGACMPGSCLAPQLLVTAWPGLVCGDRVVVRYCTCALRFRSLACPSLCQ